jgi:hypothetical protein
MTDEARSSTDTGTADDTALHIAACEYADNEAFRQFGTDSISDKHLLWPRWLEFYDHHVGSYYHAKGRTRAGNSIG